MEQPVLNLKKLLNYLNQGRCHPVTLLRLLLMVIQLVIIISHFRLNGALDCRRCDSLEFF